ncbi:hypothetical protein A2U01_0044203 [Trifolium medium]|uniref:Uncharacterized protein n=1 Tax=Trifolium medium TaxID=97028 RepID=A0A392QI98_9FABA|nr:hypothetical protein [Trifolium medium]
MESNKVEKSANKRPKLKKGRKKSETSTSQNKRPKEKKELKVKQKVILSDSDETDEDLREFLRTYKPYESCSDASSPDEDDETVTMESKGRVLKPSLEVGLKPKPLH